jgi:hypothetical protein
MITLTREEAQQVLDALKHLCLYTAAIKGYDAHKVQPPIDMLKAKLKQPEQVIQARKEGDLIVVDLPQVPTGSGGIHKESEPVAYINVEERKLEWATPIKWETPTVAVMDKVPLYTAPPQREWVGLTDDEINEAWGNNLSFARAIEAKLKEKNA